MNALGHCWVQQYQYGCSCGTSTQAMVRILRSTYSVLPLTALAARSALSNLIPDLLPTLVPIQNIYTLDAEESWDAAIVLFCV